SLTGHSGPEPGGLCRQSLLTTSQDLSLYPGPNGAGRGMQRKALAEMHDLKQVVANRQAGFAMRDVGLDLGLFSQLQHSIYIFRQQLLTVPPKHRLSPIPQPDCLASRSRNRIRAL